MATHAQVKRSQCCKTFTLKHDLIVFVDGKPRTIPAGKQIHVINYELPGSRKSFSVQNGIAVYQVSKAEIDKAV